MKISFAFCDDENIISARTVDCEAVPRIGEKLYDRYTGVFYTVNSVTYTIENDYLTARIVATEIKE